MVSQVISSQSPSAVQGFYKILNSDGKNMVFTKMPLRISTIEEVVGAANRFGQMGLTLATASDYMELAKSALHNPKEKISSEILDSFYRFNFLANTAVGGYLDYGFRGRKTNIAVVADNPSFKDNVPVLANDVELEKVLNSENSGEFIPSPDSAIITWFDRYDTRVVSNFGFAARYSNSLIDSYFLIAIFNGAERAEAFTGMAKERNRNIAVPKGTRVKEFPMYSANGSSETKPFKFSLISVSHKDQYGERVLLNTSPNIANGEYYVRLVRKQH